MGVRYQEYQACPRHNQLDILDIGMSNGSLLLFDRVLLTRNTIKEAIIGNFLHATVNGRTS